MRKEAWLEGIWVVDLNDGVLVWSCEALSMASCGFGHGGYCLWSTATSEKGEEVFVQRLNAGGESPACSHRVEIMVAR